MTRNIVPEKPTPLLKTNNLIYFISMKPHLVCHEVHKTARHEIECILLAFPRRQRGISLATELGDVGVWGVLQNVIRNARDSKRPILFLFNLWSLFCHNRNWRETLLLSHTHPEPAQRSHTPTSFTQDINAPQCLRILLRETPGPRPPCTLQGVSTKDH